MNIVLLYNLINIIFFPLYIILILVRLIKGKENFKSLKSRLGIYKTRKKKSQLIWIHAGSVGESIIAIHLIEELKKKYQDFVFLVTTGTLSSAHLIMEWLPKDVYHEFKPVDNIFIVNKFYKYWQPNLGIFIESDIWPTLVSSSVKRCRLLLLNARLSNKSFWYWKSFPKTFRSLINFFSYIAVQSKIDLEKYHFFRCPKVENLGNLKFSNKKLRSNKKKLFHLKKIFGTKRIFVASSTHEMDEVALLEMIYDLKNQKIDNFYPIIILRHPERGAKVSIVCKRMGLKHTLRSSKIEHNILEDDLYIVDSFGELGLFYTLSEIVFIGGSFETGGNLGGHNLIEPAYFDNVIIVGPNMTNFQNITEKMIANRACIQIRNAQELKNQILFLFNKSSACIRKDYKDNAKKYIKSKEKIFINYLKQIDKFIND